MDSKEILFLKLIPKEELWYPMVPKEPTGTKNIYRAFNLISNFIAVFI